MKSTLDQWSTLPSDADVRRDPRLREVEMELDTQRRTINAARSITDDYKRELASLAAALAATRRGVSCYKILLRGVLDAYDLVNGDGGQAAEDPPAVVKARKLLNPPAYKGKPQKDGKTRVLYPPPQGKK